MTPIELINTALSGISELQISSIQEQTPSADKARAGYSEALFDMLSRHRWSFLMDDAYLKNPEETKSTDFQYKFLIPNNMERLVSVQKDPFNYTDLLLFTINRSPVSLKEYQYRGDNYIYSNYTDIYVAFMRKDIENLATLPSGFKKAFLQLLKAEYAISLKASTVLANFYSGLAEQKIRTAISNDIAQARVKILRNNDPNVFRNPNYDYEVY